MKKFIKELIKKIKIIEEREEFQILLYRGEIDPKTIDMNNKNILGQALSKTSNGILLKRKVLLKKDIGISFVEPIGSDFGNQINTLFVCLKSHLEFYLNLISKH